jgi:5-formyltetrahydrofolate cyclo-ligase
MSPTGAKSSASESKKNLRLLARATRKNLVRPEAGARLRDIFLSSEIPLAPDLIVGGYWPMGGEMDSRPLLTALDDIGIRCALPVVVAPQQPLIFRHWRPGDLLKSGAQGTQAPLDSAPELLPDLLFVPLLAFDSQGYRLGQGGGYYDRTLAKSGAMAVGLAYAGQEIAKLPHEAHDARLDWIVTEAWARKIEL